MHEDLIREIEERCEEKIAEKQNERDKAWKAHRKWYNPATWFAPRLSKCEKLEIKFLQYEERLASPELLDEEERVGLTEIKEYLRERTLTERYCNGAFAYKSAVKAELADNPTKGFDAVAGEILSAHEATVSEPADLTEFDKKRHEVQKELCGRMAAYRKAHPIIYFISGGASRWGELVKMKQAAKDDPIKSAVIQSKLDGLRNYKSEKAISKRVPAAQRAEITNILKKREEKLRQEFFERQEERCRELGILQLSNMDKTHLEKEFVAEKLKANPENALEKAALELFMGQQFGCDRVKPENYLKMKPGEKSKKSKSFSSGVGIISSTVTGACIGAIFGGVIGGAIGAAAGVLIGCEISTMERVEGRVDAVVLQNKIVRSIAKGKNISDEVHKMQKALEVGGAEAKEALKTAEIREKSVGKTAFSVKPVQENQNGKRMDMHM